MSRFFGVLLAIFGRDRWSVVEEYQGASMFRDQADLTTYVEWPTDAGLGPLWDRFIPEGTSRHALVLARAQSTELNRSNGLPGALTSPGASLEIKRPDPARARYRERHQHRRRPVMTPWKRWQDYATMAFGVLLFISPFVLDETSHHLAAPAAYVLGVLLFVSGIVAAATREPRRSLIVNAPGLVAVVTLVAAVLIGIWVHGIGLAAGLMAILTVVVGATLRLGDRSESKTA